MNDPYAMENLAYMSNLQRQALQDLYEGKLVPEGMVPTQSLVTSILEAAPKMYELYGGAIGEDWLKRYLPQTGSTITQPMRDALLAYERAMAPQRGVSSSPLASQYARPAGMPTLNTRMTEAGHQQWLLGQFGQWYNPVTGQVELMPSVRVPLAGSLTDIYDVAGSAQTLGSARSGSKGGAGTVQTPNYQKVLNGLSAANPYRNTLQSIISAGSFPTMDLIQGALKWEADSQQANAPQVASGTDVLNRLASLAYEYPDRQSYVADLAKHYQEIVAKVGIDGYTKLIQAASTFAGKNPNLAAASSGPQPGLLKYLFGGNVPQATPADVVGQFIEAAKKNGTWGG